jgi:hypothetical protein
MPVRVVHDLTERTDRKGGYGGGIKLMVVGMPTDAVRIAPNEESCIQTTKSLRLLNRVCSLRMGEY